MVSSEGKHLLHLISSSGFFGAERMIIELSMFLQRLGWHVHLGVFEHVAAPPVLLASEAERAGLRVERLPCGGRLDLKLPWRIRRYILRHRIDVAHSHGYKADIYLKLAAYDHLVPLVSTCHNWLTHDLKLMLFEMLDKLVLLRFDHVVAVSPEIEAQLSATGIPRQRLSHIENGLDLEAMAPGTRAEVRRELGIEQDERLLISVGRMDRWKAQHVLLEAMARLNRGRCRLLIVGDGELRQDLEAQKRRLGLGDRVLMLSYRRDIPRLLHASDIFVLCSIREGLPMVILEAMAAGLPVISTAVGGIPEVLLAGQAGVLIPPDDPEALAGAMTLLLDDPDRRQVLARLAHEHFLRRYSRRVMGEHYHKVYRKLLHGHRPA